MAFPVSVPSLPAAFVLIPVAAPFRSMSETLHWILVHLDGRAVELGGDLEYFKLEGAGADPAASIY